MNAWTRLTNWMTVAAALALLVFTGCRSSNSGGCSGGCCRGQDSGPPPAVNLLASDGSAPLPAGNRLTSEERPYSGQKTYPVTGEDLGSMGLPIPVTVQG